MTRAPAPMAMVTRVLLMGGGIVGIVLGAIALFFWHTRIVELTGGPRVVSGIGFRLAEAAVLYGGSWLCVRAWNGGPGTSRETA
ncbi:hypothetical protein SNS2_1599 [Streptomyces netropsis]|uniref:Uncharacterized protein n=1 Tax=Streptomyces syringium TaxID=76729 RepID=A0ABS4Y4Z7_9ACTN|nr:hypothetical protein [Streptomyces syringium]MBP2402988.1 hypothetical protein [Streptomyces syringium]SPE51925.1 hypothetical protein SNS2_1599 [Streptomyces netropsis]